MNKKWRLVYNLPDTWANLIAPIKGKTETIYTLKLFNTEKNARDFATLNGLIINDEIE